MKLLRKTFPLLRNLPDGKERRAMILMKSPALTVEDHSEMSTIELRQLKRENLLRVSVVECSEFE